ncbi:MAG: DUF6132 family protein [Thiohalospira sp.]
MKKFILKHKYGLIILIPGIIAGFLYWRYVGCLSGTCPITSNWHSMVLFGGLIGYFIGDSIDNKINKMDKKEQEHGKV